MTVQFRPAPPKTGKELFERLVNVVQQSPHEMPHQSRYNGTGAPGNFLEDLLGLTAGNADIPDSLGWELKYYTPQTHLVTLFHKEPKPAGIMRYMVRRFGQKDQHGRRSFRHTIRGKSDRFRVDSDANQIFVRPIGGNGSIPYWAQDDILSAAGAKLRCLVLVQGSKKGRTVTFDRIDCFEDLQISFFVFELVAGSVCIDFDARESKPDSQGLRNHGTKFRVAPNDICRLYRKKERLI